MDGLPTDRSAHALAALLAVAGTAHFLVPSQFDAIVPRVLPGSSRAWTYASGVAELGCAALLAQRRTQRLGATLASVLFVAVFPGNVQMAIDWCDRPAPERSVALLRLPLQIPLIVWAWRVRSRASAPQVPAVRRTASGR